MVLISAMEESWTDSFLRLSLGEWVGTTGWAEVLDKSIHSPVWHSCIFSIDELGTF